jgi:hypothetical protein
MRKNISLSHSIEERAKRIIEARGFTGLSDLVAALIREEYERRNPPVVQPGQVQRYPEISPADPSFNEGANLPPDPKHLEEDVEGLIQEMEAEEQKLQAKAEAKKKRKKNS